MAKGKPLVVTEMGLSVSKTARGTREGYGGHTIGQQRSELVRLWDDLFQAGAQGGTIFEWNDEWWKHTDFAGDERTHEDDDPEEWFGLVEFRGAQDVQGHPRPSYLALKAYNQAVLLSPVTGQSYDEQLPVTVYATDRIASVRFRLGKSGSWMRRWAPATRISPHWWKATIPLEAKLPAGEHLFIMEALDAKGRLVTRRERLVAVRRPWPDIRIDVQTDRE
ncbi:MAG: hypothetical protein ACREKB_01870, partial [Candidatus Rokuibacteriota bacterium]